MTKEHGSVFAQMADLLFQGLPHPLMVMLLPTMEAKITG